MNVKTLQSDILLLVTAIIWGVAFVAQRVGMEYVGPFTFNGIRFALGSLSLLPLLYCQRKLNAGADNTPFSATLTFELTAGILAGIALFMGASLQQVGLVYTTAGKAGFITGLYVVIVPIVGFFWRQRPDWGTWLGAFLAAGGLYLLSVTDQFTIAFGDLLELIGAIFWAGHVLIIGFFSPKMNPLKLACYQFATCAVLSLVTAVSVENIMLQAILRAAEPILYGGLGSVGIAYTFQVIAQRNAHPAHAAILLSLEAVFAAAGGWLLLGETLSIRGITGCGLMLSGMLLSQLQFYIFKRRYFNLN